MIISLLQFEELTITLTRVLEIVGGIKLIAYTLLLILVHNRWGTDSMSLY